MNNGNLRKRILEVDVLRPLAVLLVVILHSFTVYWGKWAPPEGFVQCTPYKWIAATSFSFTMELFVLLSGYVFAYQLLVLKKSFTMASLARNKFRRLILPSLFFGIIYGLIFYWNKDFPSAAYAVLNGAGHLWFLPMLFWSFLLGYGIFKARTTEKTKFIILTTIISLSVISLPLRLDRTLYYLFFFYLGMFLMNRQDICQRLCKNNLLLISAALVYLTFFISYELFAPGINSSVSSEWLSVPVKLMKKYWIFVYALSGSMFFFLLVYRLTRHLSCLPKIVLYASSISFGVYLLHQIILEVLYYKTDLPVIAGPYWLPWIGLFTSLAGSILCIMFYRKFKEQT